jgi:hypothetical protein
MKKIAARDLKIRMSTRARAFGSGDFFGLARASENVVFNIAFPRS